MRLFLARGGEAPESTAVGLANKIPPLAVLILVHHQRTLVPSVKLQ